MAEPSQIGLNSSSNSASCQTQVEAYSAASPVQLNEVTWAVGKARLLGLGHGQWLARLGERCCGPSSFAKACQDAQGLDSGAVGEYASPISRHHIDRLNCIQAGIEDEHGKQPEAPPRSERLEAMWQAYLTGGASHAEEPTLYRQTKDGVVLAQRATVYPDDYPELPVFLDRRTKLARDIAA